tara:strand:+ start:480 stop:839 length:360 start_codon:yes stop_codon:yes gene_type:complete
MSKDLQSVREVLREVTDGSLAHYSFQDNDDAVYALIDKATVALTTLDNIIARQESNGWQDIETAPRDTEKDKLIVESVNNAARYKEALENIGNNIFDSGQDSGQYMAEVARNALNIKED